MCVDSLTCFFYYMPKRWIILLRRNICCPGTTRPDFLRVASNLRISILQPRFHLGCWLTHLRSQLFNHQKKLPKWTLDMRSTNQQNNTIPSKTAIEEVVQEVLIVIQDGAKHTKRRPDLGLLADICLMFLHRPELAQPPASQDRERTQ